ncbi:MAG: glycosyltransferase [Bryobacterales bacterium]|nr:glycosyltransferase [Bryobacterales bacterium]
MKPTLIVLAKDPAPGRVKTRLAATMGDHAAAAIYRAMVADVMEALSAATAQWTVELHLDRYSEFYERFSLPVTLQAQGDLGAKLHSCLSGALERGAPFVTAIGSDAPALQLDWLNSLSQSPADVTLGPTEDGGFWGIQARRTSPRMFDGVRWSTASASADTVKAVQLAGLSTAFGALGWDIDEAPDLDRAAQSADLGKYTASAMEEWRRGRAGSQALLP